VFFDISDKLCLVVGGGRVAERKVRMLLQFRAKVKIVSPRITMALSDLVKKGRVVLAQKEYSPSDLQGVALVFAATDLKGLNEAIKRDAAIHNIPVNVVDDPTLCDFIVPSVVRKGPIVIAISTSGSLPLLSKKLRKEISAGLNEDYVRYARVVGKFRFLVIERVKNEQKRREIMAQVARMDIKELANMRLSEITKRFLTSGG
jgi:precorrin-2 dehydrogenase / sirohydrochlorin ferrochelatase